MPMKLTRSTWATRKRAFVAHMKRCWIYYVFVLPAVLDCFIFRYVPMYGLQIAFKNYKVKLGIWRSDWVGLNHIMRFLSSPAFPQLMRNTLLISLYSLVFGFPVPIMVALMMNELRNQKYKRFVQTATYAPHFISTVALVGLLNLLLARETGIVNQMLAMLG